MRIGLQLEPNIEFDVARGERGYHRLPQIIIRRPEWKPRNARTFFGFRPDRVLHGLAFAEEIRHAAKVRCLERARLRFHEERLHDEIEQMRLPEIEEVKD